MPAVHRLSIMIAGLMLLSAPAAGQHQDPPAGGTPKDFNLPASRSYALANGLQVTLVPYGDLPKATVRLIVGTGHIDEGPSEVWLADLTGDLLTEGTTSRGALEIAESAAQMGGSVDVGVGADETTISGSVLSERTADLVRLIADVAQHPLFPESELPRLKADRVRQLNVRLQQPRQQTLERFRNVLYGDHPYGRVFPTEEMLHGFTIDQVRGYYERNVGAARAHLFVVGRFDAGSVEAAVRESFDAWRRGPASARTVPTPTSAREIHLIDRPGAPQSTIYLGLPVIDPSQEDWIPLQVTNAMLGGSFASRITSNIREDKGYTYSPFASISARYRDAYWVEVADVTTEFTGASLEEIFFEIERLRTAQPSEEELEGTQNYLAGTFVLQNSSRTGIINRLAFTQLHGLPNDFLTTYVHEVYQVTPADIQRVMQAYLRPQEMLIVITGDKSVIETQVDQYGPLIN